MSKRNLRDKQYELTPAENALLERVANDQDTASLELPIGVLFQIFDVLQMVSVIDKPPEDSPMYENVVTIASFLQDVITNLRPEVKEATDKNWKGVQRRPRTKVTVVQEPRGTMGRPKKGVTHD